MTYREFSVYLIIGGTILGALFGLIPLMLGRRRNKARLGLYGFLATIVAGALTGLFSIIVAAIFAWVITRSKAEQTNAAGSTEGTPTNSNPE